MIRVCRDYGAFVVAAIESGKTSGQILATTGEVAFGEMAMIWVTGGSYLFSIRTGKRSPELTQ